MHCIVPDHATWVLPTQASWIRQVKGDESVLPMASFERRFVQGYKRVINRSYSHPDIPREIPKKGCFKKTGCVIGGSITTDHYQKVESAVFNTFTAINFVKALLGVIFMAGLSVLYRTTIW